MVPSLILLDPIHNDVHMIITILFLPLMPFKEMDLLFLLLILLTFFNNLKGKSDLFVSNA